MLRILSIHTYLVSIHTYLVSIHTSLVLKITLKIVSVNLFFIFVSNFIQMAKIKKNNRELVQSYLFTTAKYDFKVPEKRIFYKIIEMMQEYLQGKELNQKHIIQPLTDGYTKITMPVSSFLKNPEDENYMEVKKALLALKKRTFEYEDEKVWMPIDIITKPVLHKEGQSSYVTFEIHEITYNAFLDFSKGYRKYELQTAMEFSSIYAMRFYVLFSGQKDPITYSIPYLKERFKIENKYNSKNGKNAFIDRVIKVAQKELDEKSPYTFSYKTERGSDNILFIPVYQAKNADVELERKAIQKQTSLGWELTAKEQEILIHRWKFTKDGLKNNISLFRSAKVVLNLEEFILDLNPLDAKNPPAFLIGALRKQLASGEKKNSDPAEPKKELTPEEIQSMSDEQYEEYKKKQRTNYSDVFQGSGSKMREMFGKIGKTE